MESSQQTIYTADVTAHGGRNGHVKSTDGVIDMPLTVPGNTQNPKGTNPEQLFAAGYAACFHSALQLVARQHNMKFPESTTVRAQVDLDKFEDGAYGLAVRLKVDLPDFEKEKSRELVNKAHAICPYSVGVKGNIKVDLDIV